VFRLALALGMTVGELLARISSRELSEWMAFFQLEPWGAEVEDWRTGLIASTIANVNRDPKKRRKPYEPEDFMPQFDRPEDPGQSPDDHEAILRMWQRALEARDG